MLKQELNSHEIDFEQNFPIIWFESKQVTGYITEPQHLEDIQDVISKNILNAKCTQEYYRTKKNPCFGFHDTHTGSIKLRDLLKEKGIDISNLNLFA